MKYSIRTPICSAIAFGIATVFVYLLALPAIAQSSFLLSPYYGVVTQTQGYSAGHPAYDYSLNYQQVLAADGGTVTHVGWADNRPECHNSPSDSACGYGLHIYIQHSNGYTSRYAHLSSAAFAVGSSGSQVQAGQIIGTSGNTGWSTGPHLHFEVKNQSGGNVDPGSPNLWKDGQWASPSRPLPAPVNSGEIIVEDNTDNSNGFSKGGGGPFNGQCINDCAHWTRIDGSFYYTLVNGSTEDSWAHWQPTLPGVGGVYEIYIYVANNATYATTWQASYTIIHGDGTSHATVDQEGSRGRWLSIGVYRMASGMNPAHKVHVTDATGETQGMHCGAGMYCRLAADGVKFVRRGVTYAPDVRYNNGNWISTVVIRNNGGGPAKTVVKMLKTDGAEACLTLWQVINAHSWSGITCVNNQWATTVVDSSQDVSVVVVQERTTPYTLEAYPGVSSPSAEVRIAIVQRNNSSFYSDLFIQNAGGVTTSVIGEFLPAPGYGNPATFVWNNLAPNARLAINTNGLNIGNGSGVFVGSLRITNSQNQPLAVASTQYKDSGGVSQLFETSNSEAPAATLYAPLIQNNNNGFSSGLVLSRSGSGAFDVRYYHNGNGIECSSQTGLTSNPQVIYPAPPAGNNCPTVVLGKLQSSQSAMVANVNQLKTGGFATTYAAIASPARSAIVTRLRRDNNWNDGFVVANFGGSAASVTVQLYNKDGTLHSTPISGFSLDVNRSLTVLGQIPAGFLGSAVVTASQPVAVTVNALAPGSGDVIASYPAAHR